MPIFEFRCSECGHVFEELVFSSNVDYSKLACPICHAHSAEKLMKILDEIIFISKTEYGIYPLNQETRQLTEVFTDIYHLTHLQAANRHISLKISNPEPNCYIKTDKQCLIQALVILIDTGISASKEGTIELFTNVNEYTSLIEIKLNLPCYLEICSEDTNLLNQIPTNNPQEVQAFSQKLELSPGMKLLLSQNLFTVMGVNLEIVKVSPEINQHPFTQLQCSFPLISVVNQ